jgi:hypothetical protein
MTETLFDIYHDLYMQVRAAHHHPDQPIIYRDWTYLETTKPRGWTDTQYNAYFTDIMRVHHWYRAARTYATDTRKRSDHGKARQAYRHRSNQLGIGNADIVFT